LRIAFDKAPRAADDEQAADGGIEAAADQVGEQSLADGSILARSFHDPERVLVAIAVDADRRQHDQVLIDVNAVDLDDQQIQRGKLGGHPCLHRLGRQRHEATRHRRFGHAGPSLGGDVAAGQADGAAELAGRHAHQHQIERPLAEQILVDRRRPTRQGHLTAVTRTHARTLDFDLAAVKADLSLGPTPTMTLPIATATMTRATEPGRILFHHPGESGQPGRQAQAFEAGTNLVHSFLDEGRRRHRRPAIFNIGRDIPHEESNLDRDCALRNMMDTAAVARQGCNMQNILAIGDSHCFFWTGRDGWNTQSVFQGVNILHCGPATAHNLTKKASTVNAIGTIEEYMKIHGDDIGCLILCFGEIDCRAHVVKTAIIKSISITDAVKATVDRYILFIDAILKKYKIPTIVWGPTISSDERYHADPNLPAIGTNIERNFATYEFNRFLREAIESRQKSNIHHLTTIDSQIDFDLNPIYSIQWDGLHLSTKALRLAKEALLAKLDEMSLGELKSCLDFRWPITSSATNRNVAVGRPLYTSSMLDNTTVSSFLDIDEGKICFHTKFEERPYVAVDLGSSFVLDYIEVFNSRIYPERLTEASIHISEDNVTYKKIDQYIVAKRSNTDGSCVTQCGRKYTARFVKLQSETPGFLHLSCMRVVAPTFALD